VYFEITLPFIPMFANTPYRLVLDQNFIRISVVFVMRYVFLPAHPRWSVVTSSLFLMLLISLCWRV
jgi:hypothetical protein